MTIFLQRKALVSQTPSIFKIAGAKVQSRREAVYAALVRVMETVMGMGMGMGMVMEMVVVMEMRMVMVMEMRMVMEMVMVIAIENVMEMVFPTAG